MKSINEKFNDEEHSRLKTIKGKLSWHDFIILLALHAEYCKSDESLRKKLKKK